jgi:hypothetical protein
VSRTNLFRCCLVSLLFSLAAFAQKTPPSRVSLGIAPVFDASGDPWGEDLAAHITFMMFDELRNQSVYPVLINPGGVYNPMDEDWIREYGKQSGVDAVLVTTLQRSQRPREGDWTLKVEALVIEVNGSGRSPSQLFTQSINRRNLYERFGVVDSGGLPGRAYEKQPLGKYAKRFAESAARYALANLAGVVRAGSVPAIPTGGPCEVAIRVKYPNKSESQAYQLVVNDREESLWIKQGVARVQVKGGVMLMLAKMQDAPYRLPVQNVYQATTLVDCSQARRDLTLEIGPAGEGLLVWQ